MLGVLLCIYSCVFTRVYVVCAEGYLEYMLGTRKGMLYVYICMLAALIKLGVLLRCWVQEATGVRDMNS